MDQGEKPNGEPERTGHPMFPRPETATGPDLRRFDLIQLRRWVDGKMEICPRTFRGSDLRLWETVVEMFGGGRYQAAGIDERTHQFSCFSEIMNIAGPPMKPFIDGPQTPPPAPAPPAPPPATHVPPGYYPPSPYGMGGGELVAAMRVMLESAQANQTVILKLLLDKQDSGAGMQALVTKTLLERLTQNPADSLRENLMLFQTIIGMGNSGAPVAKTDDFGDLASLLKVVTTLKTGATTTNEPATPKPAPAEPQPAGAAQVQTATTKPKKRKSRPPVVPPGYAGMPPFGPPPFQPWPWHLPAPLYGMMQHPAFQAWAAAYAQAMRGYTPPPPAVPPFPPPWGMPPMPNAPAPTPAPVQNAATPPAPPVPPAPPTPSPAAPPSAPPQKPVEAPIAEEPELEAAPIVEEAQAEHVEEPQLDAASQVEDTTTLVDNADEAQGAATPAKEFDPFASLRAMLAEAHASYRPNTDVTQETSTATSAYAPGMPPSGLEPMMGAFALYMSAMQSNPTGMAIPPPTIPGELVDEEDDFDEDDEEDEEDEDERAPDVPVPEVPVPEVIAMAAADPEFEAALPEQLRPILRSLMGKPRGES